MLKKILIGFGVLILLLAAGAWFGFSNLDRFIRAAVEKYGTVAAQTEVKLDRVHLSLTSGEGSLGGLSVANPQGFSSNKAFNLGSVTVKVDVGSIRGNGPIVIQQIAIDKPQVSFELSNSGSTNLQTLEHNVQSYAAKAGGGNSGGDGGGASSGGGQGRKVIINDLIIRDGQISISQQSLGAKQLSIPLPTIHLTNIGKDSGGASPAQVAGKIIDSISSEATTASLAQLAKDKINGVLKAVPAGAIGGSAATEVGNKVQKLFGQ